MVASIPGAENNVTYLPAPERYERMTYRFCGRSGLQLPLLSLGLWHNFGDASPLSQQRKIVRTAFDLGITHFDLANNYGPPYGSAEVNFGRILRKDLAAYRDELFLSTKAGWDMWPGPYGQGGGSRKYVLASLAVAVGDEGVEVVEGEERQLRTPSRPGPEGDGNADAVGKPSIVMISVSNQRSSDGSGP
jgi:Predicted oxidoreductases (related to aryl-alcohol dehydrogenases)